MADRIERAAIRHPSGKVYSVPRPGRHHDVLALMAGDGRILGEQGFITSDGDFVDRYKALKIAKEAGQLLGERVVDGVRIVCAPGGRLYSEDVW